ncbi:hypothetical protein VNI00_004809 [Paramarasmius palmivorus]|uniref:Uncharacterized protein n=1 Tax=Paramarasmius palmivorus TaxID=297713 RepID=A0AAW0DF09_9AGAR
MARSTSTPKTRLTAADRLEFLRREKHIVPGSIELHSVGCARCGIKIKLDARPKSGAYYLSNWVKHRDHYCKGRVEEELKGENSEKTTPAVKNKRRVSVADTWAGVKIMPPRRVTKVLKPPVVQVARAPTKFDYLVLAAAIKLEEYYAAEAALAPSP